ncbi:MAG TPA: response regulator [Beijerinckiaceae bacterium]|jgi:CheY-like chemotaxis protein
MNPASTSKPRILVVEDEPIARDLLNDLLRMAGFAPVCVGAGEQALLTLRRERGRIDGLFTHIELPGLVDGWIVAEEFRNTRPLGPIVLAGPPGAVAQLGTTTDFVASPVLPPKVIEAFATLYGREQRVAQARHSLPGIVEAGLEDVVVGAAQPVVDGPQRVWARG